MADKEKDQQKADEAREQAGERSMRPDIQAGALEMAEGDERVEHEHPSYRKTAQDEESNS